MQKKAILAGVIILGIGLVAALAFTAGSDNGDGVGERGTVITHDESGFNPEVLIVDADTTITIHNESQRDIEFSSDPHPAHTANPEMNAPVLPPGESQELHLTTTGDWGYHDHLNPSATGRVVVE